MTFTSKANWEKYLDTGDNSLLNNIEVSKQVSGDRFVIAGEGWDKEVVVA